jgi:hypothetical protein
LIIGEKWQIYSLFPFYVSTKGIQSPFNILVTAVNLLDIADGAHPRCTHGGNEKGNTSADVRARHAATTQLALTVVADNDGTVGVAQDNLSTHVNQAVNKEQAALKHFLME